MIDCKLLLDARKSALLIGFRLSGHAGCGEAGEDIVCAAVSSAAYLTANTLTDVVHANVSATVDEGFLRVQVASRDAELCRVPLEGFKLHLLNLEEQYPQAIQVSYEEV